MGLDLIEFTLALEDAFGLFIPDADAERLLTPALLADYLEKRVRSGAPPACLEQRAFYHLRRAGMQVLDRSREAFHPDTPWADLLHPKHISRQWELLGKAAGLSPWPRLKPVLTWGPGAQTVGETARTLASSAAASLLHSQEGWNRSAIEQVIRHHMAEELGVTEFAWTDRFVQDLGCS